MDGGPAGLYDSCSSDDDDFFPSSAPNRRHYNAISQFHGVQQKIENDFQDAINAGDIAAVQDIIRTSLNNNVNAKLQNGWTPLMHACLNAQEEIVEYLLENGADVNLHGDSITPLLAACTNESADSETVLNIIRKLIEKGAIVNAGDKYGQTPLMRAVNNGRVAIVQELLKQQVNIEMRDQQGWTAVFWTAHSNQPEILEILIGHSARLQELDRNSRSPLDIAEAHQFDNIVEILKAHIVSEEDDDILNSHSINNNAQTWHDYYPGVGSDDRPSYKHEIPSLLYGMNCERLIPLFEKGDMDLRSFLLMDEGDMEVLGIELPFERRRLKNGLKRFHMKGWKVKAVSGLYAKTQDNYSVLDCVTTLGSHHYQLYLLEATLQYALRDLQVKRQLKFEPKESPVRSTLDVQAAKILRSIAGIQKQLVTMQEVLKRISRTNPRPADLIQRKHPPSTSNRYVKIAIVFSVLSVALYHSRNYFTRV